MATRTKKNAQQEKDSLTFDDFWRSMMELREESAKIRLETRKDIEKTMKAVRDLSRNVGGVNNSLGRLTEAIFSPGLEKKFKKLGYDFTDTGLDRTFRENGRAIAETDVFMENTTHAMAIEIKTKLTNQDIDEHIARLEEIKGYMAKRKRGIKLLGAVAGGSAKEATIGYAHKNGLYVLLQTGSSVKIAKTPPKFAPKEW
jgi:hypothetical protein